MFIKKLRQQHFLSQERLAESSGLSLRTIQRVESGHRVSYSSLRKLAAAFDMNVDILERELYAMNNKSEEYNETPLWIRLLLGKGWFFGSKDRYEKMTPLFTGFGVVLFSAWLSSRFWFPIPDLRGLLNVILLSGSVAFFMAGYLSICCIRIGDKYRAWQVVETGQPKPYSGTIITGFLGLMLAINTFSALGVTIGPFGETDLEKNPPWQLLGIHENEPAFKNYLAGTRLDILATDGDRKLFRLYDKGLRLGVNTAGKVDLILLNANFPFSLKRDMARGDVENLIGEAFFVSDLRFGNLKAHYLIEGNKLDIDSENVILEILYHSRSPSLTDLNATLAALTVIQGET